MVGYGKADKAQIQEMVRLILGLATVPHPDDAADALAVAICHVQSAPFRSELAHRPATNGSAARTGPAALDEALVERGLAENRSRARGLIMAADVLVNGVACHAGRSHRSRRDDDFAQSAAQIREPWWREARSCADRLWHRGARLVAADFGASTGGFTDCLLQRGAARVYAIDVGYGQLASRLRADPRVVVIERTNVRHLEPLPERSIW